MIANRIIKSQIRNNKSKKILLPFAICYLFTNLLFIILIMNLRPLNDRLIVKALPKEEVTKSGIIIPDTVDKERPEQGEVIAVGPGKLKDNGERVPMSIKVGEKVMFKKYAPDEIKIDNEEYLVLSEYDILAVVESN